MTNTWPHAWTALELQRVHPRSMTTAEWRKLYEVTWTGPLQETTQ